MVGHSLLYKHIQFQQRILASPLFTQVTEKNCILNPKDRFQYRMLPFALPGVPATFQKQMDRVLQPH